MSKIYRFDGSGGCDFCKEATGYSIDEEPIRPHPGCDCPIVEIDPADLPDCELVLKDHIIDVYEVSETLEVVIDACDNPIDTVGSLMDDEDEEEGFDKGLRELVVAAGWSPPPSETLELDIPTPANRLHNLQVHIYRYVAIFEAEVAYVCTINGESEEVPGGQKTGFYEKNVRLSYDLTSVVCSEGPHDVPDLADDERLASYLGDEDDEDTG